MTSRLSGYFTMGSHANGSDPHPLQKDVTAPVGHTLMISFHRHTGVKIFLIVNCSQTFSSSRHAHDSFETDGVWKSFDFGSDVAHTTELTNTYFTVQVSDYGCVSWSNARCFQLLFSIFSKTKAPQVLSTGFWNCSVKHYSSFEQHVSCNLKTECDDGRDETDHCSFSDAVCQGLVALCGRCYKIVRGLTGIDAVETDGNKKGNEHCRLFRGRLAFPTCTYNPYNFLVYTSKRYWTDLPFLLTGLYANNMSLPNMYRHTVHEDRTVYFHSFQSTSRIFVMDTSLLVMLKSMKVLIQDYVINMLKPQYPGAVCEVGMNRTVENPDHVRQIALPSSSLLSSDGPHSMTVDRVGQLTHNFLLCASNRHKVDGMDYMSACHFSHPKSHVSEFHSSVSLIVTPPFTCSDGLTFSSFTLVCDFINDCPDHSDESFCKHHLCVREFTCVNGQCLSFENVCDQTSHCQDESEEQNCLDFTEHDSSTSRFPSPALINFDGTRRFVASEMEANDSCPDSHYRCPGEFNDCLPLYTRCNGMYDCIGHEDEDKCGDMTCPGFFRCRRSTVCLHGDGMCDGWPHCPDHDDELGCSSTCPSPCLCQIYSFLCPEQFRADFFPQIRYLDATGSGMTLSDVSSNAYLIHLVLVNCSLTRVPELTLLNLKVLDLRDNSLQRINMTSLLGLQNLLSLSLSNNPITLIHAHDSADTEPNVLKAIDLSLTKLTVFDSRPLEHFPRLQKLNVTFTSVHSIGPNGFHFTPQLTEIYLEGSPIKTFPLNVFSGLFHLNSISAQSYKLCCREVLPADFPVLSCTAPEDEISSCQDLLQSWIYRGFLWLMACLSVTGNIFCFCARLFARSMTSSSGYSVFVTNLTIADFVMGVYMAVIGVADERFRGRYLHQDDSWKSSAACKVAGFLCLLSSEVSALIICLITVDRFIVLCFPFSTVRFERTSALVVCLLVWLVGWVLASLPLLPVLSHWEFYSQTGICIPLPVTRQVFKGKVYSFGVMIVLNFVLFLLISVGQGFIYWAIQKHTLKTKSSNLSHDMTIARRLISIALTDFACWFPTGLCAILATTGVPIPGEVNVALAVFVLPLNSAINPFMYTLNTLAEKWRKSKEEELLKWIEFHADTALASYT